jgi:hypothetical protein
MRFPFDVSRIGDLGDDCTQMRTKAIDVWLGINASKDPGDETLFKRDEHLPSCPTPVQTRARNPELEWPGTNHDAATEVLRHHPLNRNPATVELLRNPSRERSTVDARVGLGILAGLNSKLGRTEGHMIADHGA